VFIAAAALAMAVIGGAFYAKKRYQRARHASFDRNSVDDIVTPL
jgi:hypothetical protein